MKHKKLIELMLTSIIMLLVILPNSLGSVKAVDDGKGVHYDGVRIDGQYPLGVSSDYLLVAGNRLRRLGDGGNTAMIGRFMANSMNFEKTQVSNNGTIGSNSLNKDNYNRKIWNPAVVINDLTAESKITGDPIIGKNPVERLVGEIAGMSPYDPTLNKPNSNDNIFKFITDSSKEEVESVLNQENPDSDKFLDYIYNYKFDTKENGEPYQLSDLTQFSDNDVTKYQYENPKSGKSVQNDIANVSEFYSNLTPGTDSSNNFWSSDDSVVSGDDNPIYSVPNKYNQRTVYVTINITNNPSQSKSQKEKALVAANIDLKKINEVSDNHAEAIQIVLKYSNDYYTDGYLDPDKIPYLILNYKGFENKRFEWGYEDQFLVENAQGRRSVYDALGVTSTDVSNASVLNFSSRVLNNFVDSQDSDNNPEDYNQEKQNVSGITKDTAAVFIEGKNWFGSILVAHGSFYADNSSALYIGGVIASNNITLYNVGLPPERGDAVLGKGGDFPTLSVNSPTIDSVTLQDSKDENKQTIEDEGILTFSYDKNDLKPAPDLGLSGTLNLSDVPNEYGLYYRLNNSGDWQRFSDSTVSGDAVKLDEQFITTLNNSVKLNPGTVENSQNQIIYPLKRTSQLQFATTADATESTLTVEAMKTKATATFSFGLEVSGSLKLTVPEKLLFGTEILGQSTGEVTKALDVNEIQSVKANVADQGTVENPKIIVNNPMLSNYHLQLAYLGMQSDKQDNPFYLKDNFKFKLDNTTITLTSDTGWSSDISSRQNESLVKQITESPLQSKTISFTLPYSNQYKVNEYQVPLSWQLTI